MILIEISFASCCIQLNSLYPIILKSINHHFRICFTWILIFFWLVDVDFCIDSGTGALAIFLRKSFQFDITTSDYNDQEIEDNIAHNCRVNGITPTLSHIKRELSFSWPSHLIFSFHQPWGLVLDAIIAQRFCWDDSSGFWLTLSRKVRKFCSHFYRCFKAQIFIIIFPVPWNNFTVPILLHCSAL